MPHPLPTEVIFSKLLAGLLGKPAEVKKYAAYDPKSDGKFSYALFIDDSNKNAVMSLADIPLTCSIGAMLTMIPAGVAKDAIKSGEVPEMIFDNMKEVYNIATSMFNVPGSPHLRLGPCVLVPPAPSAEVATLLGQAIERADFQITVPNYGSGMISFRWLV